VVELLKLFKFWVELGVRYVRGQCTPQEEFAIGIVIAALGLLVAAVVFGGLQLAFEHITARLYIPPQYKDHRFLGRLYKIQTSRFSASKYYKWVGRT